MRLFITGTGTDVGKTFVTAMLNLFFLKRGIKTSVVKLVATGCQDGPESPDITFIQMSMQHYTGAQNQGRSSVLQTLDCFAFPASPHLAAEKEGKKLNPEKLMDKINSLKEAAAEEDRILLVEGAGGLMVPLNRDVLLIDLIARMDMETVIVSSSWLGTINHTLLSIEALSRRKIPIRTVILNSGPAPPSPSYCLKEIVKDNRRTIREFSGIPVIGPLEKAADPGQAMVAMENELEQLFS